MTLAKTDTARHRAWQKRPGACWHRDRCL